MDFTETEKAILRVLQDNIPLTRTPYADIAASAGASERDVLDLIERLKASGVIRRFGASIKHQRTGYTHNAMVAWRIAPEDVDKAGREASTLSGISHCYYRPSDAEDWPYTFYTMIHGRSEEDCLAVIEELKAKTILRDYAILKTVKELKKISMRYFG